MRGASKNAGNSRRHHGPQVPSWVETVRAVLRFFLIAGWTMATMGVALFTYSEAYPKEVKNPVLGSLTLSQCGFWLISSGLALVAICVVLSQITLCWAMKASIPPPVAVTTGMGTGYDEEEATPPSAGREGQEEQESLVEEETSSLIGSGKVNYGSTVFNASPFSASSLVRTPPNNRQ